MTDINSQVIPISQVVLKTVFTVLPFRSPLTGKGGSILAYNSSGCYDQCVMVS